MSEDQVQLAIGDIVTHPDVGREMTIEAIADGRAQTSYVSEQEGNEPLRGDFPIENLTFVRRYSGAGSPAAAQDAE
jgi:hypothetical protein